MYQLEIEKCRLAIQEVNDSFDIVYDGKFFQELWEYEKRKHTFNWNNRNAKHDAF